MLGLVLWRSVLPSVGFFVRCGVVGSSCLVRALCVRSVRCGR